MTDPIYVGSMVTIEAAFTVEGVATDPTTVTLVVKTPSGGETTYTYPADIQKDATGVYTMDYEPLDDGVYYYRWEGTGACDVVNQGSFTALPVF